MASKGNDVAGGSPDPLASGRPSAPLKEGAPLQPIAVVDGRPPIVVPLDMLDRDNLALAGGKAANLGELLHAGLPVPPGYCVTTAAYARMSQRALLEPLVEELAAAGPAEVERLAALADAVRQRFLATPIPDDIAQTIRQASTALGVSASVAVRSSATAEDLPFASFAGQQDTYLNIVGPEAVLEAVRRCWASLWSERAVVYRARYGIDQRTVRLAVVIQRLVDAAVAGVLFTANPVTGHRKQIVINAHPGLGEAIVSGTVNPDHVVVDAITGEVLERRLGDKRVAVVPAPGGGIRRIETGSTETLACLSDEQLRMLVQAGQRVETHFGVPQDIEFAIDHAGALWLVQARPITTLFPLPDAALRDSHDLHVYFSFNVAQGVFRPFTPLGSQALRLVASSLATLFGAAPRGPRVGPSFIVEAAGRLFFDVTELIRSPTGRRLFMVVLDQAEGRSAPLLQTVLADPRLATRPVAWRRVLPGMLHFLVTTRLPLRLVAALLAPALAHQRLDRLRQELAKLGAAPPGASATERLDLAEHLLQQWPRRIASHMIPLLIAGLGSFAIADRLLGDLATLEERDAIRRALPHNPTMEMDLALWTLAQQVRADPASAVALRQQRPAELAVSYRAGNLPPVLQNGLAAFLVRYGHRALAEIDLGVPRWSEDPAPVLTAMATYLARAETLQTPDAQFRATATQAEATVRTLVQRAARRNWLRGRVISLLLGRGRALAGLRELPKFLVVLLLARVRTLIGSVGEELAHAGWLEQPDDVFFLTLPEVRTALQSKGADLQTVVRERRATYDYERQRQHLPRLLLSDGTEPEIKTPATEDGEMLKGTPASAGRVTGRARVVLDPVGAHLEPGEILVAPATDPGWTPLFLTAGGLVMEIGGAISHGAVVAREYGIPAVVGVAGATERIRNGQEITVDGTAGIVLITPGSSRHHG